MHFLRSFVLLPLYSVSSFQLQSISRTTRRRANNSTGRRIPRIMSLSSDDTISIGEQRIAKVHKLLKGLETGDPNSIEDVIHPDRYIQHNPQTDTDKGGLKELFARISKTNPHVNFVRSFSDGDFVFLHTEYDFATRRIGFEVFHFEELHTDEHWDNIMPRKPDGDKNPSGRSMVDGATEVRDLDKTEVHRELAKTFFTAVASGNDSKKVEQLCNENLLQHNPHLADGRQIWLDHLLNGNAKYKALHRVLAQGNFCLCVSEGHLGDEHTAFYDLVRFEEGKIVEHWDTVEHVAPRETWKNENGKF